MAASVHAHFYVVSTHDVVDAQFQSPTTMSTINNVNIQVEINVFIRNIRYENSFNTTGNRTQNSNNTNTHNFCKSFSNYKIKKEIDLAY